MLVSVDFLKGAYASHSLFLNLHQEFTMFASKTTMTEIFKTATKTIDGITMYVVCSIFIVISIVFGVADFFDIHLPFHGAPAGFGWIFCVPVLFMFYITIVQFQLLKGKLAEVVNALILSFICAVLLNGVLKM